MGFNSGFKGLKRNTNKKAVTTTGSECCDYSELTLKQFTFKSEEFQEHAY